MISAIMDWQKRYTLDTYFIPILTDQLRENPEGDEYLYLGNI